jgi:hypothetical protein
MEKTQLKQVKLTTQDQEFTKVTEAVIYDRNPFVDQMLGEVKIKNKTQTMKSANKDVDVLLMTSDGEVAGHSSFLRRIQVDEDKFAKLFISQIGALWDLKKPSLKVLSYILSTIKPNEDRVFFDVRDCLEYCGWSASQSLYNGLLGLINAKIIARTNRSNFYYINPAIVFNGSRVTFITQYEKKKKNNPIPIQNQLSLSNNDNFLEDPKTVE